MTRNVEQKSAFIMMMTIDIAIVYAKTTANHRNLSNAITRIVANPPNDMAH